MRRPGAPWTRCSRRDPLRQSSATSVAPGTGTQSEAALLASQYPVNSEHVCFADPDNPSVVTLRRGYRPEHAAAYMPLLLVLMGGAVFVGVVVWLVRQHRAAVAAVTGTA